MMFVSECLKRGLVFRERFQDVMDWDLDVGDEERSRVLELKLYKSSLSLLLDKTRIVTMM
jgi:hypothetical protein